MQRRQWTSGGRDESDDEGNGVVLIAHSLGNLVVRYFFDWLRNEVGANSFQSWVDKNIYMYVAFFLLFHSRHLMFYCVDSLRRYLQCKRDFVYLRACRPYEDIGVSRHLLTFSVPRTLCSYGPRLPVVSVAVCHVGAFLYT
jgi:hypothetical protein